MRTPARGLRLAASIACIAVAAPAHADAFTAGPSDRVALDPAKDALIVSLGVVLSAVPLALTNQLAPSSCRWCDGTIGSPVNPVDDWFHQHLTAKLISRNTANFLSSGIAFGLMPAVALGGTLFATGPDATKEAGLRNLVIVAESVAVAEGLTQGLKFSVARQRPYLHYQHIATAGSSDLPALTSDANLSFPSGHTSFAASAGTSAAMLATLEHSPAAPWLWGATGVITVATGTLRMASESHYFTDVVGGALIGVGSGVLFPLLHRRGSALDGTSGAVVTPVASTASVGLVGAF